MQYFGDFLPAFLKEATVVKGSVFDKSKCVLRMQANDGLLDALVVPLKTGGGNFFKWRDELITLYGVFITSDKTDSQLLRFYGLDLPTQLASYQTNLDADIGRFAEIVKSNAAFNYCDMLSRLKKGDFLQEAVSMVFNKFLNSFKQAVAHTLFDSEAFKFTCFELDTMLVNSIESKPEWDDVDWVRRNVNIDVFLRGFIYNFNSDLVNNQRHRTIAKIFTDDFCNKQDFKAFCKFRFSRINYKYFSGDVDEIDTTQYFNRRKTAMGKAFLHQGSNSVCHELFNVDVNDLLKLEMGDNFTLKSGIQFIRRKELFQIKMPNKLAQVLQLYILKYNRSGVERLVA